MRKVAAIVCLLTNAHFCFSASNAIAQPSSLATGARNMAILAYAEKRCPSLRINLALVAKGLQGVDKAALAEAVAREAEASNKKLNETFGGMEDRRFCELMEDMFGPGGTTAENFLKKR
jgi:hypothetical protein